MCENITVNKFAAYASKVMKISQAELSRRSGLSRQTISHFFSEKSVEPDRETVEAVAKGLKIPLDTFYRESGALPSYEESSPVIEETAHIMKNLSGEDQLDIREYARLREKLAEERRRSAGVKRLPSNH